MHKSEGVRRPVSSNIGVQRRRLCAQEQAIVAKSPSERGDGGRAAFGSILQDKKLLQLDRRQANPLSRSPIHSQRPDEELAMSSSVDAAESTIQHSGDLTATCYAISVSASHETSEKRNFRSSSEKYTPPTILTNPDLDILPVVKTQQARASFDFYVNSYVTSIIEVSPHDIEKYSHVVHQILHDDMLFTAFTTCSEAARWRTLRLHAEPPLSVVKGYGKTISLLSDRLRAGEFAMSPAILLTMGQLVAIETLTKNVSATAKHLAGMQSVMAKKNSAESSSDSSPVQAAVDVWGTYFGYRAQVKAIINRDASLNYPKHPFPPDVSRQISELPLGFADVALSGRLSVEMLDLLEKFNTYFTEINQLNREGILDSTQRTHIILWQAAYCIEYAQIQSLTLTERLVLAGLTGYVVRRDRIHPGMINMRGYYQITCANLLNVLTTIPVKRNAQDADLLNWVGLILLLTSSTEAYARKLALQILSGRPEPMRILKQCQKFFWDDDLTSALLSGSVLTTQMSNDIIAENVEQAMPES